MGRSKQYPIELHQSWSEMSEFSKDELVAPEWLDRDVFNRALRSYQHDPSIEVTSFEITPGSKPGEHFASIMFKVNVTYSSKKYRFDNKNIKLILKTMPVEGIKLEFLKNSPAFKSEARMYLRVLPEMERVLENGGIKTKFAPNLVYASMEGEKSPIIIMEDVSPDGFKVFDRLGVTSEESMELILKKLAQFHAASLELSENGLVLTDFNSHVFWSELEKEDSFMIAMMRKTWTVFTEEVKAWGPDGEVFYEKLNGRFQYFIDKVKAFYRRKSPFSVLCHGDFHGMNLLQRNGCAKDEDLLFVDYQFPFWTSPAMDIFYFFSFVANFDAWETRRNDLILVYYEEFRATLKSIGFRGKVPTLLDLHVELIQCSDLEIYQTVGFLLPRFLDFSKIDPESMATDPDLPVKMARTAYQSEDFRNYMTKNLKRQLFLGAMN